MSIVTAIKSVAGTKGTGWHENKRDKLDRPFVPTRAALPIRASGYLTEYAPAPFDQGATSSCVAQAISGAIATREMFLSAQVAPGSAQRREMYGAATYLRLSRRALYSLSRASHGDAKNDSGTYIRAALQVLRRHGCPLESDFAWSVARINQTVPAPLVMGGYELAELQYEFIVAGGDEKIAQIRAALREGHPVVFGSQVTASYQRLREHTKPYEPGHGESSVGGHAQYIVDCDADGHCTLANSWGSGFGNRGLAYVHAEWVKREFRDLTVIKGWRRARAAEQELAHVA